MSAPEPRILSKEALLAWIAAVLVSLAFFPEAWFGGKSLYSTDLVLMEEPWSSEWEGTEDAAGDGHRLNPELGDLNHYFFPQLAYAVRTKHESGSWPLWNPEIYGGVSLIGNPQVPLWNPFIRVLPWFQETGKPFSAWRLSLGLTWTGILRFVLCVFFGYLWLRRIGAGPVFGSAIALFLGAGPYPALWRFSTPEQVYSLMPMALYFIEGLRQRWHAPSAVGLALGFGLSCLGGYPQTSLVFGLFLVGWIWWRASGQSRLQVFLRTATCLGLGLCLALPCWLPFLSYLEESSVAGVRAATAALDHGATWLPDPRALIFPNLQQVGIESHQVAIGVPLILLLVIGLWQRARGMLVVLVLLVLIQLDFLPLTLPLTLVVPLLEPSRVGAALPLLLAAAWLLADRRLAMRLPRFLHVAWTGVALLVLLWPGLGFHGALDSSEVYPETPTTRWLEAERQKDPDLRLLHVDPGILDGNAGLVFDQALTMGYDGMDPERWVFLFVHLLPEAQLGLPRSSWTSGILGLDLPLFDQFATGLVLAKASEQLPDHFRVEREVGEFVIARNPRAAPRAQLFARALPLEEDRYRLIRMPTDEAVILEGQPPSLPGDAMTRGSVEIRERGSDEITLVSEADGASYVLLRDNLLAGWQAEVDGEATPILRGNFAFRAVVLPAGKHEIRFRYRPASYEWGVWLALLALASIGLIGAFGVRGTGRDQVDPRSRSGSPAPEAGPSRS